MRKGIGKIGIVLALAFGLLTSSVTAKAATQDVKLDSKNFPDAVFREYLDEFDLNSDRILSSVERNFVNKINIVDKELQSLKGLEYFPELVTLKCEADAINYVDLSGNQKLQSIYLKGYVSNTISFSNNTQLQELQIESDNLTGLDVSKNTALVRLAIKGTKIQSLNLDNNTKLKRLEIEEGELQEISLKKNSELNSIWMRNVALKELDLSKNTKLMGVVIQRSQLSNVKLNSDDLESFWLTYSPNMKTLDLGNCRVLRNYYNTGKKTTTSSHIEYGFEDSFGELALDPNIKVINNVVIKVAAYDLQSGVTNGKGGTVTGGGTYNTGDLVTIKAKANTNDNYVFKSINPRGSWNSTDSYVDKVLSTKSTYQFTAKEDMNLVALFLKTTPYEVAFSKDSVLQYGKRIECDVIWDKNLTISYPTLTYQWYRGNQKITGANNSYYTLQKEDIGKKMSCVVSCELGGSRKLVSDKAVEKKAGKTVDGSKIKVQLPSREGGADGVISGVNTQMEYSTSKDFAKKKTCPDGKMKVKAGTYYIRYAMTDVSKVGKSIVVKMPDGPAATAAFTDLQKDAWYIDAVKYVYAKGIMNGVSERKFDPMGLTSRAQFVTMLYNLAGTPKTTKKAGFQDVAKGIWYEQAVDWAYAAKITSGVSKTKFGPDNKITRQEAAVMLYQYAVYAKRNTDTDKKALDSFSDKKQVASWAKEAFEWAVHKGVINGKPQGNKKILAPKADITRAECAQMFKNMADNVKAK